MAHEEAGFIPLFNGRDLGGWSLRGNGENCWRVENGVVINDARGSDIYSEAEFGDFQVRYEYLLPPKSNSGVYLRGRYEIQIWDTYGQSPTVQTNGALYGRIVPAVEASRPAGTWQTVDTTLRGRTVTVVLNGQTVIDGGDLGTGPTRAAMFNDDAERGPILLQGDHGPVSFRHVRLRPL